MRHPARFILRALLACLFFLTLSLTSPVQAAGITVNSNADISADDGFCTLREAIDNANSDSQLYSTSGECAAGSGADTITFDPVFSGPTIYLGSPLIIASDMTIDGSALTTKIAISGDSDNNGTGDVRVFSVGSGVSATLNSLIVTKGWSSTEGGGGLVNNGTLTIINSVFSANTVDNQLGGAILNNPAGILTITGSTFSNNSAYDGGAITNYNQLTVTNSTFIDNGGSGTDAGGAIYTDGPSSTLTQTVTNSTFSGNSANVGGAVWSSRTQTITNSTFSGNNNIDSVNGRTIWQDSETLNYTNNIVANSTGGDCYTISSIGIHTNNLVEDGGNCAPSLTTNPNLGPLADNGGLTQTFALLAGSPAIDAGDDATCAASPVSSLDQRGTARPTVPSGPGGGHCDIGAYEYIDTTAPSVTAFTVPSPATSLNVPITTFTASDDAIVAGYMITQSSTPPGYGDIGWTGSAPTTYTVSSVGDYTFYPWTKDAAGHVSTVYGSPASVHVCLGTATVTSNADSGPGSLRQAISDACAGGTINFNASLSGNTIHLASTLDISKNLTIDGSSLTSRITISGDTDNNGTGDVRVFQTTGHNLVNVALNSLIVTKGFVSGGDGGGLLNDAITTITNSIFDGNTADNGGAITTNGALTIIDSTFSGNSSAASNGQVGGGAILNNYTLSVTGSTFSGNTADAIGGAGGALFNVAQGQIYNSTFSGNLAGVGGAILTTNDLTIQNSTISGNSAFLGGGLYVDSHVTNLVNTIIANSTSGGDCSGTLATNTNNLIEDGSCSPALSGDPLLGPLADNGGPTQTFALLAGSNAIDAGDDTTCAASPVSNLDQRGITRPNSAHCDIGAYEYADASIPTVTAFTVTSLTNSLTIPIMAFTASDDATLTGYMVTETSTPPPAGAAGWTASAPTTYTVGSAGSYTLYPWVKDAVGNVSAVYGSSASVTVDKTAPTAGGLVAANVTTSGGTTYSFTVSFSDNLAIDSTSIDGSDIRVTGPGGFNQLATLVSVTPGGNGTPRTATYRITAPGGAWDTADRGAYAIAVEANQVFDTAGNGVGAASLGSFLVSLNYTAYLPLALP
jgi:CSLREA domain-containing protein